MLDQVTRLTVLSSTSVEITKNSRDMKIHESHTHLSYKYSTIPLGCCQISYREKAPTNHSTLPRYLCAASSLQVCYVLAAAAAAAATVRGMKEPLSLNDRRCQETP